MNILIFKSADKWLKETIGLEWYRIASQLSEIVLELEVMKIVNKNSRIFNLKYFKRNTKAMK